MTLFFTASSPLFSRSGSAMRTRIQRDREKTTKSKKLRSKRAIFQV